MTENQLLIAKVMKSAVGMRRKSLGAAKRLKLRASFIATELELLHDDCVNEGLDPEMTEACLLVRADQLLAEDEPQSYKPDFLIEGDD